MIPIVEKLEVVAQKEKLLKDLGTAYVVLLHLHFLMFSMSAARSVIPRERRSFSKGALRSTNKFAPTGTIMKVHKVLLT